MRVTSVVGAATSAVTRVSVRPPFRTDAALASDAARYVLDNLPIAVAKAEQVVDDAAIVRAAAAYASLLRPVGSASDGACESTFCRYGYLGSGSGALPNSTVSAATPSASRRLASNASTGEAPLLRSADAAAPLQPPTQSASQTANQPIGETTSQPPYIAIGAAVGGVAVIVFDGVLILSRLRSLSATLSARLSARTSTRARAQGGKSEARWGGIALVLSFLAITGAAVGAATGAAISTAVDTAQGSEGLVVPEVVVSQGSVELVWNATLEAEAREELLRVLESRGVVLQDTTEMKLLMAQAIEQVAASFLYASAHPSEQLERSATLLVRVSTGLSRRDVQGGDAVERTVVAAISNLLGSIEGALAVATANATASALGSEQTAGSSSADGRRGLREATASAFEVSKLAAVRAGRQSADTLLRTGGGLLGRLLPGDLPAEVVRGSVSLGAVRGYASSLTNCSGAYLPSCCFELSPFSSVGGGQPPQLCLDSNAVVAPQSGVLDAVLVAFGQSPLRGALALGPNSSLAYSPWTFSRMMAGSAEQGVAASADVILTTSVLLLSLSSYGEPLKLGEEGGHLVTTLPRLSRSHISANRLRVALPPFSCTRDSDCSGSSWQRVGGRCVNSGCVCPPPYTGIDCARILKCRTFDDEGEVWREAGCSLLTQHSVAETLVCSCPVSDGFLNATFIAGVEEQPTRSADDVQFNTVDLSDLYLLDPSKMFSARLFPLTLVILLLDVLYLLGLCRSLRKSNEGTVRAHVDMYAFWADARERHAPSAGSMSLASVFWEGMKVDHTLLRAFYAHFAIGSDPRKMQTGAQKVRACQVCQVCQACQVCQVFQVWQMMAGAQRVSGTRHTHHTRHTRHSSTTPTTPTTPAISPTLLGTS